MNHIRRLSWRRSTFQVLYTSLSVSLSLSALLWRILLIFSFLVFETTRKRFCFFRAEVNGGAFSLACRFALFVDGHLSFARKSTLVSRISRAMYLYECMRNTYILSDSFFVWLPEKESTTGICYCAIES